MIRYTLREIAQRTGGSLLQGTDPEKEIHGVGTDTRTHLSGRLFVALRGPRFDGHDFVEAARKAGAAAVLVQRPSPGPGVLVADPLAALQVLAAAWRRELGTSLAAVTGSCGKTTVKEILAAMLRQSGPCLATRGNLNNHIGVPLTLAELGPEHRHAVVEMGMNHAGEIAVLTRMARPDLALINNAGPAHIENLGSIAAIAAAKGEILEGLSARGIAVINGDDEYADYWAERAPGEVWRFSLDDRPARVRGQWRPQGKGGVLDLRAPQGNVSLRIPLSGRHNGANVLAAATAALALNLGLDQIARAVEALTPAPGRLQWREGKGGSRILDDTYNANPASVEAALRVLAEQPGRRYLVLGDMAELGADAELHHQQMGGHARALGIDGVFTLGSLSRTTSRAFGPAGTHFVEREALVDAVLSMLAPDAVVLVKGSRAAHMERVVAALTEAS